MTTDRKTRVLFNWKPRSLDGSLSDRLRSRLLRAGWYTHILCMEIRRPFADSESVIASEVYEWHKDQGAPSVQFIVWSNIRPTEVRFADGSLLPAKDGDVILIDNAEVEHRAPANSDQRWF